MMSSARHRLDLLLKKTKRLRRIDSSVCRNIMATTRELMEAQKSQGDYQTLNLYCNWILHNEISASMAAIRTLEEISERLLRLRSSADTAEGFLDFFSQQAFQLDVLRQQFIEMCVKNNLKDFIFKEYHNWNIFSALMLQDLINKPIQFPKEADSAILPTDTNLLKKAKLTYSRLTAALQGNRRQIFRKAWVSLDKDPWDERPEHQRQPLFHCNVQGFDGPTFRILMTNISPIAEADEYSLIA